MILFSLTRLVNITVTIQNLSDKIRQQGCRQQDQSIPYKQVRTGKGVGVGGPGKARVATGESGEDRGHDFFDLWLLGLAAAGGHSTETV